jgi:hypothetical protein
MAQREKIATVGVKREDDHMYFVKAGDIWATRRSKPGEPSTESFKVATVGVTMDDKNYLYFVDQDGDIARIERAGAGDPLGHALHTAGNNPLGAAFGLAMTVASVLRHRRSAEGSDASYTVRLLRIAADVLEQGRPGDVVVAMLGDALGGRLDEEARAFIGKQLGEKQASRVAERCAELQSCSP